MILIKHLEFTYHMRLQFDSLIKDHYFSLKCVPHSTARQQIEEVHVTINPVEMKMEDQDSFGNKLLLGNVISPHSSFEVNMHGTAVTGIACYEEKSDREEYIFRSFSKATYPGAQLLSYHKRLQKQAPQDVYEKVLYYMRCIYRDFTYCPGATGVSTTAENALRLGQGVCQDYAHIMLALCRIDQIPARYVVGMMTGEGYSHAWTEVKCRNYWYGFDPTNNYLVDDHYIKISQGRDFFDCLVNKGIYHNAAAEVQEVWVRVNELSDESEEYSVRKWAWNKG